MAHTSVSFRIERVLEQDEHRALLADIKKAVFGFDVESIAIDSVGIKHTVEIKQDDLYSSHSMYDDDNEYDVRYCEHGRYNLSTKDAEDPFESQDGVELDGHWLTRDQFEYAIDMLTEFEDSKDIVDELTTYWRQEWEERKVLRDDIALILPIYLYDHSGLTVSHGSFSCQWDSGQVGWHYMTKKAMESFPSKKDAEKFLEARLEEWDHVLQGNVWYFDITDEEGDSVESCGGFIGDDLEDMGMLEHIPEELHDAAREAWEERFS